MSKFRVCAYSDFGEGVYSECFSTPKTAIEAWFQQAEKYPTMTNLLASTKSDAIALIEWADNNPKFISEMHKKYKCYIKLNYLLKFIKDKKEDGMKYFYENEFGGDSVYPFSAG